ncbi:MAG: hypothetical protein AB8I08_09995 [Sandaracinaceae bacterium]
MSSPTNPIQPVALAVAFAAFVLASCVPNPNQLVGRPCPCAPESGFVCVDGICVEGGAPDAGSPVDAGASDAGTADAGAVDSGRLDAGPLDAGPLDASVPMPPGVPTTCWTRTTSCDWSDPTGFEFIEGDTEVIADLNLSSNPTFSPDGCELYYSDSAVMHVARRTAAGSPFVAAGPVEGIDQDGSRNSKAAVSPDQLQLFFTSDRTDGAFHTIHRSSRDAPDAPWGAVEEVAALTIRGLNNWDGVLAPHGLRYYWSPNRDDTQFIFMGERASLDAPFSAGVAIPELADMGAAMAEPAVSADGRVLVFITDAVELSGGEREIAYATRAHWQASFGEVRAVPGPALATGVERESTVSPDACEVLVLKAGTFLYLTYEAR